MTERQIETLYEILDDLHNAKRIAENRQDLNRKKAALRCAIFEIENKFKAN